MANYNIFFSPTGGTKKVAEIITGSLNGEFQDIDICHEIDSIVLNEGDICLVSVPSYGGRVPGTAAERLKNISGCGAKAILNCVYGNRVWEDTLTELQDILEDRGFVCVAAVAAVAEHSIFRQFATGRPDVQDREELIGFGNKIQEKLDGGVLAMPQLEGAHGTYKVFCGTPLKPVGDENCGGCGLCAEECPAGAIDLSNPKETDTQKCISCMRCIDICPNKARNVNQDMWQAMAERMTPVLSGRKENHLFI